jgi:hypothetical protein
MSEMTAPQEKLANQFASVEICALKKTFIDLNDLIYAKATGVSEHLSSANRTLEDLLPYLGEMQSFLSQRGSGHNQFRKAGLPSWTKWFRKFNAETGLDVSIRAVQKQLAKARGTKPRKKSEHPAKESAHVEGRVAHDTTSQPLSPASSLAQAVAPATNTQVSAHPPSATNSMQVPKPGDWNGLVANVGALCGGHIRATFAGLDKETAVNAFGKFIGRLAQTYCVNSEGDPVEMRIVVEPVRRNPPRSVSDVYRNRDKSFGYA